MVRCKSCGEGCISEYDALKGKEYWVCGSCGKVQ